MECPSKKRNKGCGCRKPGYPPRLFPSGKCVRGRSSDEALAFLPLPAGEAVIAHALSEAPGTRFCGVSQTLSVLRGPFSSSYPFGRAGKGSCHCKRLEKERKPSMDREETAHPGGSPSVSPELQILHCIATGIVRYQEQCVAGPGGRMIVDGTYPEPLQRGLDLLNVLRYRKGLPLVKSVEDLLAWCRKPLAEWSLDLDLEALGWELTGAERLLEGTEPSGCCLKLASLPLAEDPPRESRDGSQHTPHTALAEWCLSPRPSPGPASSTRLQSGQLASDQ